MLSEKKYHGVRFRTLSAPKIEEVVRSQGGRKFADGCQVTFKVMLCLSA